MRCLPVLLLSIFFACKKQGAEVVSTKTKVIILGSSISTGVGASEYSSSWVGLLANNNKESAFINFSVPGYTTFHFLPANSPNASIPSDTARNIVAVLRQNPRLVIISITTNDIAYGYTPDRYMSNMKVITDSLAKYSIKYLITSPTFRDDLNYSANQSLLIVSYKLRERYPTNYVDVMSGISDTTSLKIFTQFYTADRIHPNNLGHAVIYERINSAYQRLMK